MKEFSAFRLFYNDFLYRNNVMIEYDKINKYLNKIIEVLKLASNVYHDNAKLYVDSLTKYQAKIKKELDKIMEVYPYFFEKYYELYIRYEKNNNTVADMPFVISCSFYNDYGYDDIDADYVQRFSSLDKKRLRDKAKKMSFVEFYRDVLRDFDTEVYDSLINLLDAYLNIDVKTTLSYDQNIDIYIRDIKKILTVNKRILEKAKLNDDFNIIKDKMELIYKNCFNNFDEYLDSELRDFILISYEKKKKNVSDFYDSIVTNDLGYNVYKDFVSKEKKYKEKYDKLFANKQIVTPNKTTIAPSIRNRLIQVYYDSKFFFEETKDLNKLVECINGLKSLAWDIEQNIWELVLFESSHTSYLGRNNTVRYAIIHVLYNMYNPLEVLNKYERLRKNILIYLDENPNLANKLEIKMADYNKIISKKDILNNIKRNRTNFILENAYNNLSSKCVDYDTRDYDLYYMANTLTVEELLSIYEELFKDNKIDKKELIEYISQAILLVVNPSYSLSNVDYELISDVARSYLNVEYEVNLEDDIYVNQRDQFNMMYDSYLNDSAFNKLKKEYKL